MKVLIVFYSMYGHVFRMAEAEAEGARTVPGAEVIIRRIQETLPANVLTSMGAVEAQKAFAHIPVCTVEELEQADAVIFGSPTRFGTVAAQLHQFMDSTGRLWEKGAVEKNKEYEILTAENNVLYLGNNVINSTVKPFI